MTNATNFTCKIRTPPNPRDVRPKLYILANPLVALPSILPHQNRRPSSHVLLSCCHTSGRIAGSPASYLIHHRAASDDSHGTFQHVGLSLLDRQLGPL